MSETPLDIYFPQVDEEEDSKDWMKQDDDGETKSVSITATKPSYQNPVKEDIPSFDDDIYKKWFKTRDKQGFLSVRSFLVAGKLSVDIGEVVNGSPKSTMVWVNAVEFAVYLQSVVNGTAPNLYPPKDGFPEESFTYYGGGKVDGKPVSRVLRVNHWQRDKSYDSSAFAFKAGHFAAKESSTGAFIPDMSSPISVNMIKVSRIEIAEMSMRISLALQRFVVTEDSDPFRKLNGNDRK